MRTRILTLCAFSFLVMSGGICPTTPAGPTLLEAVEKGDLAAVKEALKNSASVAATNEKKQNALHLASLKADSADANTIEILTVVLGATSHSSAPFLAADGAGLKPFDVALANTSAEPAKVVAEYFVHVDSAIITPIATSALAHLATQKDDSQLKVLVNAMNEAGLDGAKITGDALYVLASSRRPDANVDIKRLSDHAHSHIDKQPRVSALTSAYYQAIQKKDAEAQTLLASFASGADGYPTTEILKARALVLAASENEPAALHVVWDISPGSNRKTVMKYAIGFAADDPDKTGEVVAVRALLADAEKRSAADMKDVVGELIEEFSPKNTVALNNLLRAIDRSEQPVKTALEVTVADAATKNPEVAKVIGEQVTKEPESQDKAANQLYALIEGGSEDSARKFLDSAGKKTSKIDLVTFVTNKALAEQDEHALFLILKIAKGKKESQDAVTHSLAGADKLKVRGVLAKTIDKIFEKLTEDRTTYGKMFKVVVDADPDLMHYAFIKAAESRSDVWIAFALKSSQGNQTKTRKPATDTIKDQLHSALLDLVRRDHNCDNHAGNLLDQAEKTFSGFKACDELADLKKANSRIQHQRKGIDPSKAAHSNGEHCTAALKTYLRCP